MIGLNRVGYKARLLLIDLHVANTPLPAERLHHEIIQLVPNFPVLPIYRYMESK